MGKSRKENSASAASREIRRRRGFPYKVCVGTFLYLLLQAKNQKAHRRGLNNEGVTEPNCFLGLIKVGQSDIPIVADEKTIKEETSKLKYCKIEPSAWMPFFNETYVEKFNDSMENDYENLLSAIISWGNTYLDLTQYADWLVKSVLEMLMLDENIDQTEFISVGVNGEKKRICELINEKEVRVQPFLLGVWNYIVNHKESNKAGLDTINFLADTTVEVGATRRLVRPVGKNIPANFRVMIMDMPKKKQMENANSIGDLFAIAVKDMGPEITGVEVPPIMRAREKYALSDDEFSGYLKNLFDAHNEIKTLLFRQEPREFDSIYLPNDILVPSYFSSQKRFKVDNCTVEKLSRLNRNYMILSGTGGLGKSMMMRHLLLDLIKNYKEYKWLPIFVTLKDYSSEKYERLMDFIYETFASYDGKLSPEELTNVMASGRVVFLLDGLDEIKAKHRPEFEKQLEKLTNGFGDNIFIISSRPFTNYVSFSRFVRMDLCPFTKDQSVDLINKLDMGADEKPLKDKFAKDLEESLYDTHTEFAENPLLLTIMLMTYKNHSNIPVKMHKFYSKAYETLFTEHDAIKQGYVREYKTKLTQDRFAEYVDEFCFLSYQDENFDMTEDDCREYFMNLEAVEEDNPSFTWKDFMDDLTDAVCLMYKEGLKYHFLHRSFQEYFCARYFFRQEESNLWDIAMFFDEMHTRETDKTFPMLYDMKPRAVEEKVLIPFLKKLFKETDRPLYEDFLMRMYPKILFDDGEVPTEAITEPASYIYSFMARQINRLPEIKALYTEYEDFFDIVDSYVYYDPNYSEDTDEYGQMFYEKGDNEQLVSHDEVDMEYVNAFEDPEEVGWTYEVDVEELFDDAENPDHIPVIAMLYDEDFPIYKEFEKMKEYYEGLVHSKKIHKTDLRNKLRKKNIKELYVSKGLSKSDVEKINSNRSGAIKLTHAVDVSDIMAENKNALFEVTTKFSFDIAYDTADGERKRFVVVSADIDDVSVIGNTSVANWLSESYLNNIVQEGVYECTAWFTVIGNSAGDCRVQYLMIGGEITWK